MVQINQCPKPQVPIRAVLLMLSLSIDHTDDFVEPQLRTPDTCDEGPVSASMNAPEQRPPMASLWSLPYFCA